MSEAGKDSSRQQTALSAVLGNVVACRWHMRTQHVVRADDEPKLLAMVEHQADRSQVDLDICDLTRLQLLHPVEAVRRNRIRGERLIQMPGRHAQAAVGTLVPQHRRAPFGDVLDHRTLIGNRELLQVSAVRIEFLDEDEQVHVVGALSFDPT